MSECFIQEKSKTLLILRDIYVNQDLDQDYRSQVENMLQLVETRNLKISANVCWIDLKIMIAFAGQVLSYSVLLLQNFYLHH
ncbi:unnamed protein product, partial [Brenthis ino]